MNFGYRKKAKQFNYKPVYWDAEKEAREERRRAAMIDIDKDPNEVDYTPGEFIRSARIKRMQSTNRMQSKSKIALFRIAIFIVLVFAVLYVMTGFFELL